MTSNVGSQHLVSTRQFGFTSRDGVDFQETERRAMDALERSFRPEFLNRIDEIIVFEPLTKENVLQIVDIMLSRLNKHLESQKVSVEVTDAAKEFLAEQGYDPKFGARPLARAIRRYIENPLSSRIIGGEFGPDDTVTVDRARTSATSSSSKRGWPRRSSRVGSNRIHQGLPKRGAPLLPGARLALDQAELVLAGVYNLRPHLHGRSLGSSLNSSPATAQLLVGSL
jgi:hypothetical protein